MALSVASAIPAVAIFVDARIETRGPVQVSCASVPGKAPSLLPQGRKWTLVWHDEFDQKEIDRTKWMCRESFWGHDFPAFAHDFEGVEMTGETVRFNLVRKGDDFTSPHLQTGSLTYDVPRNPGDKGFWPFGPRRKPLFMKKYGYFEIRCRQPKYPGWHSAFWFQAPGVGAHPDAGQCGVETDIMENYAQHIRGKIVGGNGWGGYGSQSCWYDHFEWTHEETADGWHNYGCDWTPEGYTFYCDGKKVGEQNYPVSHVEQFLLVSTEPGGYRKVGNDGGLTAGRSKAWGKPDPRLFEAKLPDCFEVDYVRVYDAVPEPEPELARPDGPALRAWADAAWAHVMTTFYSPKTGNIYQTAPDKVSPASDFPGGLLKPELGYGRGLEDCAIVGGVALSGLLDKWIVTHDPAVAADAEKIARGLLNLATAHPYKGFVARGLCAEDGTSICRLSSRDQVTHWMHGLHRYLSSGLASPALQAEIRRSFADVAARMERNVTKENNWNFLQADGTMDPRGICKMRETHPHEAARLAMVYALAWKATGDTRWEKLYKGLRHESLIGSCALGTAPDSLVRGLMPDYTLLQMNTSLEAILDVETDEKFRAKAIGAMVTCARLGRTRAPGLGSKDTRWLCGCAEVHLAQMMVPCRAFAYGRFQQALLANAIVAVPAERAGACRATHLFAAYWRARRLGLVD